MTLLELKTPTIMTSKTQALQSIVTQFTDMGFTIILGAEVEFYYNTSHPEIDSGSPDFLALSNKFNIKIIKESGPNQFEAIFPPESDPIALCQKIEAFKAELPDADFRAKPFENEVGSGLHFHFNLLKDGVNLFSKLDEDTESDYLLYSVGGMLAKLPSQMPYFAPTKGCYKRYTEGKQSPSTISWGFNNRTCAVRIPDTDNQTRRLEHRVASAFACPHSVVTAILEAAYFGIYNKILPENKTYGDAHHPQYAKKRLPTTTSN